MTEVTEFEKIVLKEIAFHEMNPGNGAYPTSKEDVMTYCWAWDFTGNVLTVPQVKGVLSSLVKKNLINIFDWDDRDTAVDFTEEGYEIFKQICPKED